MIGLGRMALQNNTLDRSPSNDFESRKQIEEHPLKTIRIAKNSNKFNPSVKSGKYTEADNTTVILASIKINNNHDTVSVHEEQSDVNAKANSNQERIRHSNGLDGIGANVKSGAWDGHNEESVTKALLSDNGTKHPESINPISHENEQSGDDFNHGKTDDILTTTNGTCYGGVINPESNAIQNKISTNDHQLQINHAQESSKPAIGIEHNIKHNHQLPISELISKQEDNKEICVHKSKLIKPEQHPVETDNCEAPTIDNKQHFEITAELGNPILHRTQSEKSLRASSIESLEIEVPRNFFRMPTIMDTTRAERRDKLMKKLSSADKRYGSLGSMSGIRMEDSDVSASTPTGTFKSGSYTERFQGNNKSGLSNGKGGLAEKRNSGKRGNMNKSMSTQDFSSDVISYTESTEDRVSLVDNGYTNGEMNGQVNGQMNGESNGHSEDSPQPGALILKKQASFTSKKGFTGKSTLPR